MANGKHRGSYLRYPMNVYRHYWLNRWHFFLKPALKLKAVRIANKALAVILRRL